MRQLISFAAAAKASLVIYALFLLFHLAIIVGILCFNFAPVDYLWGGRMETKDQLLSFEIISFVVQALCLVFTGIHAQYIHWPRLAGVARISMWLLFVLFLLNTVGNVFAKTIFEKSLSIVTAALALFSLRLALEKKSITIP